MQTTSASMSFDEAVHTWMKQLHVPVGKKYLQRELWSHPDYPSLTALTDLLDAGGMRYHAMEIAEEDVVIQTYPLLAHLRKGNSEDIYLVSNPNQWKSDDTLKKNWSGVVITPDEDTHWKTPENSQDTRFKQNSRALALALLSSFLLAVFIPIITLNAANITWGVLALSGVFIAVVALALEQGIRIQAFKALCDAMAPGSSNTFRNTSYTQGVAGFSFSDMAFAYFMTQLIFTIAALRDPLWISTGMCIALPVTLVSVFSLMAQQFLTRKWCTRCLLITGILLGQSLLSLALLSFTAEDLNRFTLLTFFMLQAGIALVVKAARVVTEHWRAKMAAADELRQWKKDDAMFMTAMQYAESVDCSPIKNELRIGDPDAPLQITLACNPYCRPCARAFEELDALLTNYPELLAVSVRFICNPDQPDDPHTQAACHLLQQHLLLPEDDPQRREMLTDWFCSLQADKWLKKWRTEVPIDTMPLLKEQVAWAAAAQLTATPAIYLNHRLLPARYRITDLRYLIPAVAQNITTLENS
ncbi:vitamin K epoxide reductase family protein [Chitinophaga sp. Mgbs1]|uniref:Vitamin K epoxide reductase family protein n=1 Tax=Chitinophaga solisilvae TaxID=1233460 RepID=A0A3S1JHZ5_9BACT|nr:vitamin K epoxide reductase family protein [Chitinophaga solisilvae]